MARFRLLELGCIDASPVLEESGLDRAEAAAAAAAASLEPVELSGLSMSMLLLLWERCCCWCSTTTLLLWRRWRFDERVAVRVSDEAPGPGTFLGGAAAMAMTPFAAADELVVLPPWKLVGVLPADREPLAGLSLSLTLPARFGMAGGVLACTGGGATLTLTETESVEDFLVMPPEAVAVFRDRVLVPPTGRPEPEPRFRFLMTSVFRLRGRTTPWSLRKRPQALHSGWPSGFRRQSGVVWVKQFVHVVGALVPPFALALLSPGLPPPAAACRFVVDPCLDTG